MSSRRYQFSEQALADLEEISSFLYTRSSVAAKNVLDSLEKALRTLAEDPELGLRRDDLHLGIRMFVPAKPAQRYVIFYYIAEEAIEISDIVHSARDWVGMFARSER